MSALQIQTMTPAQVEWAIEQAAREGWNPGLGDARCFYQADPEGFLLGLLNGRPVGCISAVAYPEDFGFIGLYIVAPEYRGQGHGLALWQAAMARLQGRNVGLDGVPAQQDNYRKSGFRPATRNIRYRYLSPGEQPPPPGFIPLEEVEAATLAAYDRQVFPAPRPGFLNAWSRCSGHRGLARQAQGRLQAYGLIRPCREGWKIGPLFADSPKLAEQLLTALVAPLSAGSPVFLDVPENNPAALALARSRAMTPCFETARMYTGPVPPLAVEKQFGITTFELG